MDLDEDVGSPETASPVADVDEDLLVPLLDAGLLDGRHARVVVAERLERDRGLGGVGGLEPHLARAKPYVETDGAGGLEGLGPHRRRFGLGAGFGGRRSSRTST